MPMRLSIRSALAAVSTGILVLALLTHLGVRAQPSTLIADPPRKSNGLTNVVQWDNYTLFVHDQRIFLK